MTTYEEVLEAARKCIGDNCKACPVCNGRACRNTIPGPGAKGSGTGAIRNYEAWQNIYVNMDTIAENRDPDTGLELFERHFSLPVFAAPVGGLNQHFSDAYDDLAYNRVLVKACADCGIAAFTGDGVDPAQVNTATLAIRNNGGTGVQTIKPWDMETIRQKFEKARESGCFAVAMDIDAAGLPFLKGKIPPAGSKTVEQLKEIAALTDKPFILKGIMTVKGALKAKEAGAAGIVVSNHGGRVQDGCAATADVLPEIADALQGSGMKIFVDGGIRSGLDVFKALALGADAVLIGRPYITAVYGGAEEGVRILTEKLRSELEDTMRMCGVASLAEITRDCVRK